MNSRSSDSPRGWIVVPLVALACAALVYLRRTDAAIADWMGLGVSPVAVEAGYQTATLLVAAPVMGVAFLLAPDDFRDLIRFGDMDAEVEAVPWLGLRPDSDETWRHVGRNFAVIITFVTAVAVFFQVVRGGEPRPVALVTNLHWILLFASVNSFVEESICRLSLVGPLVGLASPRLICILSAAIFGGVHYFGTPGGLPGVLLAGFLGWFLAKSLVETQGVFWAWFIHFLQDVVIFAGVFLATAG